MRARIASRRRRTRRDLADGSDVGTRTFWRHQDFERRNPEQQTHRPGTELRPRTRVGTSQESTAQGPSLDQSHEQAHRQPPAGVLRRVFAEARPYWGRSALLVALSLIATPLALLTPVPMKIAVDNVLGGEPLTGPLGSFVPSQIQSSATALLVFAALMLIMLAVVTQLHGVVLAVFETRTSERLSLSFRGRLLQHVQRLSFAYHDRRGSADAIFRIQWDAPAISGIAVSSLMPIAASTFTLIAMIWIIAVIDWQMALVALVIAPVLYALARAYRLRMHPRYKESKRLQGSAQGVIQEVLTSFRVVKAFGREQAEKDRYMERSTESMDVKVNLARSEGVFGLLVNTTTAIGTATVLMLGVWKVQSGVLTLGTLLLVLSYLAQMYGPLRSVSRQVASLQSQMASAQRAFELLDEVPDVKERPNARPIRRANGDVEFDHVGFWYEKTKPVLEDVSFHVSAGTKLGIEGPTGVGKTTLVSLLNRFYDVSQGAILIDGVDVREFRLEDLRSQFAVMLQEPVLFSTSVGENILYARPDADRSEVVAAARAAGAHEFVSSLTDGYDTLVGERGMTLSGGERQRISLARAFLKDAPILILDEPTSSVDLVTEEEIMDSLNDLMIGRTTFMIAHRTSTLAICEDILELHEGGARLKSRPHGLGDRMNPNR